MKRFLVLLFLLVLVGCTQQNLPTYDEWSEYVSTGNEVEVTVNEGQCVYLDTEFGSFFVLLVPETQETNTYPCTGQHGSVFRYNEITGAGLIQTDSGVFMINYLVTASSRTGRFMRVKYSYWRSR